MRKVFAHLCTWFSTKDYSGVWEMWNSDYDNSPHNPETIQFDGRRDIAANAYPLSGLYDSADYHAIRMQFSLMRECGIDGVIVDYDGYRLNRNRYEKFLKILPLLKEYGLKLVVCLEEWCGYYPIGTFKNRKDEITAFCNEFQHLAELCFNDNYYTEEDRPVVFIFRKCPDQWYSADEWEIVKNRLSSYRSKFYFNDCYDNTMVTVADGYYFWVGGFDSSNNSNTLDYCKKELQTYNKRLKEINAKAYVPSVVPGFDDSKVWGWGDGARIAPRYEGKRYELMWNQAIESGEKLIQIVTWNDWNEGSYVEPCTAYGYEYLNMTKQFICMLKNTKYSDSELVFRKIIESFKNKK